jgi:hypothetical protein
MFARRLQPFCEKWGMALFSAGMGFLTIDLASTYLGEECFRFGRPLPFWPWNIHDALAFGVAGAGALRWLAGYLLERRKAEE